MWNIKNAALLLAACLVGFQCNLEQAVPASAYVITSQYLGSAPSRGDEHLLLFKIPEPISSQLLESRQQSFRPLYQQQQQQQHLSARGPRLLLQSNQDPVIVAPQPAFHEPQVVPHVPVQSTPRLEYEPASSAIVQEQAVSVTIPLSSFHTVESQQHQPTPPLNLINGAQYNQDPQQQPLSSRQVALELALADYLYLSNQPGLNSYNHQQQQLQIQEASDQLGSVDSIDQALKNGGSHSAFMVEHDQQIGDGGQPASLSLASVNQEPQVGQRANYSLQPSYLTSLNAHRFQNERPGAESQDTAQSNLWRDTQPQLQYAANPSANHQQVNANQSEIASLIARLSSSSPDLLIRLKNLLKRAANVRYQSASASASLSANASGDENGAANKTSFDGGLRLFDGSLKHDQHGADSDSELLMANNVSASELKNMAQEYVHNQQQLDGRTSPLSNSFGQQSLATLLSSQNISSREEIKIPLIVIAMPRILALSRNHMSAVSGLPTTKSSYNTSSLSTITSDLAQRLIRQHLPQILATNLTSSVRPLSEAANGQLVLMHQAAQQSNFSSHFNTSQAHWVAQQQITSTTSPPLHTMAPYARQFIMPGLASAPLIRKEFVPVQHQQQHTLLYPSNRTGYLVSGANGQTAGGQFREISESMLVGRQNGTSSNQLLPLIDNSGNNVQTQQMDFSPRGSSDHQPFKLNRQIQLVSRPQQPLYEIRQEVDDIPDNHGTSNHHHQQQQQYIYLKTAPERRASRFLANFTDEPVRVAFNDLPHAERSLQLTPMKSRLTLFEEQISKLRPLFQSPIKRELTSNLLSPNQMLALLSRSNERQMSSANRLQQLGASNADLGVGTRLNASAGTQRQSPNMLFMVV